MRVNTEELTAVLNGCDLRATAFYGKRPPSGADWLSARTIFDREESADSAIKIVCQIIESSPHEPTDLLWVLPAVAPLGEPCIIAHCISIRFNQLSGGDFHAVAYFAWGPPRPPTLPEDTIVGHLRDEGDGVLAIHTGHPDDGDWNRDLLVDLLKEFLGERVEITIKVVR